MHPALRSLLMVLFAVAGSTSPRVASAQAPAATPARHVAPFTPAADFVVGRKIYLRSTGTPIGQIIDADENHAFPRSFSRRRMKAVLIRHNDGPQSWLPVEGLGRIYTVSR